MSDAKALPPICDELIRAAAAVYIVADKEVADSIADTIRRAVACISDSVTERDELRLRRDELVIEMAEWRALGEDITHMYGLESGALMEAVADNVMGWRTAFETQGVYAEQLREVLEAMVAEYCDYTTRNKLGDPEKQHNIKWARTVLARDPGLPAEPTTDATAGAAGAGGAGTPFIPCAHCDGLAPCAYAKTCLAPDATVAPDCRRGCIKVTRVRSLDQNGSMEFQSGTQSSAAERGCPCLLVEPCDPGCTCVTPVSSHGCARCATYGSLEQRTEASRWLAKVIDSARTEYQVGRNDEELIRVLERARDQLMHLAGPFRNWPKRVPGMEHPLDTIAAIQAVIVASRTVAGRES